MLQKQRKVGEPTTPNAFTGGGVASKAAAAAALGRSAMSNIDKVAATARQQQEQEMKERLARAIRSCSC